MKKTEKLPSAIAVLLLFAFLTAFVPAPGTLAADLSGECGKDGDNLTWSYSGGVLTITGEGEMADYEKEEEIPWCDLQYDITQVKLPEGLTDIGDLAFRYCENLTSIRLPEGLTHIGYRSFSCCFHLTSVELPNTLSEIGDYAFDYCGRLTSIELPDSLTHVGANPFVNCERLTSIAVSADHPYLEIIDRALFSKPDNRLICLPQGLYNESYSVPDGTLSIGERAFWDCGRLETVGLPDGLLSMGDYAFGGCDDILSIALPDSLTHIGANPFYFCSDLTSVEVSPTHPYLEVIDGVLFSKPDRRLIWFPCGSDRKTCTVPAGTLSIGSGAFGGCDRLTAIDLPESLTGAIGENSFYRCYGLVSVSIPEGVTSVGDSAFFNCGSLTSVELPETLTSIGDLAFCSCKRLESAAFPEGLTGIGEEAFANCEKLTVTVARDSYGERYCRENGLNYTYTDNPG